MQIRKASHKDLPYILEIYDYARKFMSSQGNSNQWINGYPSEELLKKEIDADHCYVCINSKNHIVGTFCFIIGKDANYNSIKDGEWLNNKPYATIHRLASSGEEKGIADTCFSWCIKQYPNIRVDTHKDNIIMQHIIKKYGFQYCGIIYVTNGTPRFAYQKESPMETK